MERREILRQGALGRPGPITVRADTFFFAPVARACLEFFELRNLHKLATGDLSPSPRDNTMNEILRGQLAELQSRSVRREKDERDLAHDRAVLMEAAGIMKVRGHGCRALADAPERIAAQVETLAGNLRRT